MESDSPSPATSSPPEQHQPLLRSGPHSPNRSINRVASLLGRAAGGRNGRSALVRETAAMQLEERRADWAYSRPVVALDISWNLAFAVVSAVMLVVTVKERPNVPARVWIAGYGVQCVVHVMFVWGEYRRRRRRGVMAGRRDGESVTAAAVDSDVGDSEEEGDESGFRWNQPSSFAKRCESLNTLASFLWWIIGFFWVISGGDVLQHDAPTLYWLTVVFLAFDVFFAIFCVALACVIGIALCCCLPCIIAILYAVAGQEGATEADISILPRYRYSEPCGIEPKIPAEGVMIPVANNTGSSSEERVLLREVAECCICLTSYEDGVELISLPCNHHFHSTCIVKWLRINATCPLCKFNILKGNDSV